ENVIRILPLPIRKDGVKQLERICDNVLGGHKYVLRPHLPHDGTAADDPPCFVLMIVRSMQNRLATLGNPLGIYSDREVEFAIIIDLSVTEDPAPEQTIIALLPIYLFTDSQTTEITEREVYGLPTVLATIDSAGNNWSDGAIASAEKPLTLLRVTTPVLPALHAGLEPQDRALVEVTGEYDLEIAGRLNEVKRKIALNSRLKADIIGQAVPNIALKQFPDCRYPEHACYQSVVSRAFRVDSLKDCQYDELDLTVRIH